MQYKSSADPLYPIVVKDWTPNEREKFLAWAKDNCQGQFLMIATGGSGTIQHFTRPAERTGIFGDFNDFSMSKEVFTGIILFSKAEDQTAFLIVFESKEAAPSRW